MSIIALRSVRPWGGPLSDVTIEGCGTPAARIATITEHDPRATYDSLDVIEGCGRILVPSFSDVHVHLDSSRLGLPFRPHTGAPGTWAMMLNDRHNWRDAEVSITERAHTTLGMMIARGTTRVRSYAQVDVDCGLERLEAVLSAKAAFSARADVEVIAFPQAGVLREKGSAEVLEEALRMGAQVVGGIDPCLLDRDPVRHLDIVFGLAEKYGLPVDFHLHEPRDLGVFSVDLICERTRALGMEGRVTISHGYRLGGVDDATTRRLIDQLAELDIAVATVAPPISEQLPLIDLVSAGVRVGLGEDGQRDYWSPYGNADMLERAWQLAFTNMFRADRLVELCLAVATAGGASILSPDLPRVTSTDDRPGLDVGAPADMVLLAGDTPTAAVMDRSHDRTVLHRGVVVADQMELC